MRKTVYNSSLIIIISISLVWAISFILKNLLGIVFNFNLKTSMVTKLLFVFLIFSLILRIVTYKKLKMELKVILAVLIIVFFILSLGIIKILKHDLAYQEYRSPSGKNTVILSEYCGLGVFHLQINKKENWLFSTQYDSIPSGIEQLDNNGILEWADDNTITINCKNELNNEIIEFTYILNKGQQKNVS